MYASTQPNDVYFCVRVNQKLHFAYLVYCVDLVSALVKKKENALHFVCVYMYIELFKENANNTQYLYICIYV